MHFIGHFDYHQRCWHQKIIDRDESVLSKFIRCWRLSDRSILLIWILSLRKLEKSSGIFLLRRHIRLYPFLNLLSKKCLSLRRVKRRVKIDSTRFHVTKLQQLQMYRTRLAKIRFLFHLEKLIDTRRKRSDWKYFFVSDLQSRLTRD